jgi:hypothetical protein
MPQLSTVIEDERRNALVSWVLCGVLALAVVWSIVVADFAWTAFSVVGIIAALVPAAVNRDYELLPPWEVLALVVVPVCVHAIDVPPLVGAAAIYVGVLALAALCVVELHLFSPVEMTNRFAAGFVVLMTMAAAALWMVFQWVADAVLGTAYIMGLQSFMWSLITATIVGLLGGPVFGFYLRGHASVGSRRFEFERGGDTE